VLTGSACLKAAHRTSMKSTRGYHSLVHETFVRVLQANAKAENHQDASGYQCHAKRDDRKVQGDDFNNMRHFVKGGFHGFGYATLAFSGLVLGLSQFSLLPVTMCHVNFFAVFKAFDLRKKNFELKIEIQIQFTK